MDSNVLRVVCLLTGIDLMVVDAFTLLEAFGDMSCLVLLDVAKGLSCLGLHQVSKYRWHAAMSFLRL
eukprot:1155926-Pelagomonas_calceolata.AAC.4